MNSGLSHSWPIIMPFSIISVDIWSPGDLSNCYEQTKLLNCMCGMTEFVVCTAITNTGAAYLARIFMEHILLKFGLCIMVVRDDGNKFRGIFEQMCKALNIRFHVVANRDHKAIGIERFHKFLNHSETFQLRDEGLQNHLCEVGMTKVYAWNASPIEGTDIVRSVPAIGRALPFPLDIDMAEIPPLIDNASEIVAR